MDETTTTSSHPSTSIDPNPSFSPANDLDPNVWYHITEERVDNYSKKKFDSSFQVTSVQNGTLAVWPANDHYWQFQPAPSSSSSNRYSLRCTASGVKKQLAVCLVDDEIADGKTQPCMRDSDGSEEQMWELSYWQEGVYRFTNVANGTGWWLDVHRGNPPFMSDNTNTKVYQPAQRWLMTSVSEVNDGGFSTDFTNIPAATGAVTTTAPDSSSPPAAGSSSGDSSTSMMTPGAAAGIGVGASLGFIALATGVYLWWRRRKGSSTPVEESMAGSSTATTVMGQQSLSGGGGGGVVGPEKTPAQELDPYYNMPPQEMSGEGARFELDERMR